MPTISVIVPVYNVEQYLDRCIQSILAQSFTDFELILVDDGSPDNCPAMCDAWAEKDSRIKVIHKENGGLSDARNVGFAASCGEWITFIDSDDYVHPQMLQALYDAVRKYGTKISACGFLRTNGEALAENFDTTVKVWNAEDYYLQKPIESAIPCCKLYDRSVVLPYPKGKIHEDEFVTYRILFACKQIAVLDAKLYGYYRNPNSIMRRTWGPEQMSGMEAIKEQMTFFIEHGHECAYVEATRRFQKSISIHICAINDLPNTEAYRSIKKQLIKTGRRHFRESKRISKVCWDREEWILASIFPLQGKMRVYWRAIRQKFNRKKES